MLQGFWSDLCEQLCGAGALCGNKNGSPTIGTVLRSHVTCSPILRCVGFMWNDYLRASTLVDRGVHVNNTGLRFNTTLPISEDRKKTHASLDLARKFVIWKLFLDQFPRGTWGKSPTKWLVGAYTLWSQDDCRANPETNLFSNRTGVQLFSLLYFKQCKGLCRAPQGWKNMVLGLVLDMIID